MENYLRDREVDDMVTLKWILKKYDDRVQTVIIQLSIGFFVSCEYGNLKVCHPRCVESKYIV